MDGPYPLDLTLTTASQLGGSLDGLMDTTKRDNALMGSYVRLTACIFASGFGELDSLALSLPARFVVIMGHLQSQFE